LVPLLTHLGFRRTVPLSHKYFHHTSTFLFLYLFNLLSFFRNIRGICLKKKNLTRNSRRVFEIVYFEKFNHNITNTNLLLSLFLMVRWSSLKIRMYSYCTVHASYLCVDIKKYAPKLPYTNFVRGRPRPTYKKLAGTRHRYTGELRQLKCIHYSRDETLSCIFFTWESFGTPGSHFQWARWLTFGEMAQ
jgi:hypothetical protein